MRGPAAGLVFSMTQLIDRPKEWQIIGPTGKCIASFDDEQMARWYAAAIERTRGITCRVKRSEQ